jgi:hypothetical protein
MANSKRITKEFNREKTIKELVKPYGEAAKKAFQKEISPQGVAAAEAEARRAIERKYPGMFIPQTRTAPGVVKKKSK